MIAAYYNEIDPFAAQWLRNLIAAGHIAPGEVDDRSIRDVRPSDLEGYAQCHFFAGIGGWSYAARLAGVPDERPIWTGSCPCQPFSNIGQGRGFNDERHLWPEWFRIIRERRPAIIFGEQVDTALAWLDQVFIDLESENYACGAVDLPAACVGAQHVRQRLWFVADADKARWTNAQGVATAETQADFGRPAGLVHSEAARHFRGALKPGPDWIVDGLSREGLAVGAYGNAIVPQVAAEFIAAALATPDPDQPRHGGDEGDRRQ